MSSHEFPLDLYPDLLSRLPTKTLLKFKSVSKLWLSIIEDPKFSSMHANRLSDSCSTTQVCLLRFVSDDNQICEINRSGGVDAALTVLLPQLPGYISDKRVRLVGSSNGVLCLVYQGERRDVRSEREMLILWNPISKQYQLLPHLPPYDGWLLCYSYGFGYDKVNNDYKVLCFELSRSTHTTRAMIYSRKLNTWSTSPHKFPIDTLVSFTSGLQYGGSLHFRSIRDGSVIAFDLSNEDFKLFGSSSPESEEYMTMYNSGKVVFDDLEKRSESRLRIKGSDINDCLSPKVFPYIQTLEFY